MSTIKVDTLQTRSGNTAAVTGSGFVATDQIRGNTAANSVTVVAEGGTNTTNLQQGLCKFFSNIDGQSTIATRDSFNQSGITDNDTGDYDLAFTNNMGNDDYSTQNNSSSESGHCALMYNEAHQHTTGCRVYVIEVAAASGVTDSNVVMTSVDGDLA